MSVQNILHLKVPAAKIVLTIREGFGTHLLPVFYSGSIDLVMQNLLIVVMSKLVEFGKIHMVLISSKKGMIDVVTLLRNEFSSISEMIKMHQANRQPDASMMMLKITNQGMVQVYTSSIYQALLKISKSNRSIAPTEIQAFPEKDAA